MTVPKAELHVHIEGAATPALVQRIAARNGLRVPDGVIGEDGRFVWRDFLDFLDTYDGATSVIRTGEDYRDIAYEYLVSCAAEGAIYVEMTASADHAAGVGLSDEEHLAALAQGIDDARAETGIEGRIVMSCVRHFGPEQGARGRPPHGRGAASLRHRLRHGRRRGGLPARGLRRRLRDRPRGRPRPHRPRRASGRGPRASAAGLALGVSRIGHGVRASEDPDLVRELAERGTVLEVCPTSNVVLGLYPSYAEHPLPALRAAGVPVTLGSDDPPYWDASIGGEYAVAAEQFGLDDEALREITRTALNAAFVEEEVRQRLLQLV